MQHPADIIFRMIAIGIDVAKDKHDCQILREDGSVLVKHFKFSNTQDGFNALLECISSHVGRSHADVRVGLEATGIYHISLKNFLISKGFRIVEFNPASVSTYKNWLSMRNTKTDKIDCGFIAQLTLKYDTLKYIYPKKLDELRSLCRADSRLVSKIATVKNQYRRTLQITFPEFETVFNATLSSSIAIINKYPCPHLVRRDTRENITEFFAQFQHGCYRRKVDEFIEAARTSIGTPNDGDIYELRMLSSQLLMLQRQRRTILERIGRIMTYQESKITTIPGIGKVLGAYILSEIGDIRRFDSPEQLLAYAGCDPRIYESGKHVGYSAPINKRGSMYLRTALFNATVAAFRQDPVMNEYVNRKIEQGKHYYNAIFHGVKKMTRIIYYILYNNVDYKSPKIMGS